jgi:hypothetical protein
MQLSHVADMRSFSRTSGGLMRLLTLVVSLSLSLPAQADYEGSRFDEVWKQVKSDPYPSMPHTPVTLWRFYGFLRDFLFEASERTLDNRSDLLPQFDKLVHPNGVCLAGTWNITEPSQYTGYFRQGARGLFIGRASVALTQTRRGEYRAFGFAGKLFPTLDPDEQVPTANFFAIENLAGTLTPRYLDAQNTNDLITIQVNPNAFLYTPVGAAALAAFKRADRTLDPTQPLERQLYPISELGEDNPGQARAPRWIMIVGSRDTQRVDRDEFRDEVRLANYPQGLRFDILVSDSGNRWAKQWSRLGHIEVTDDALTNSCDHRLHFAHPRFRN